MYISSIFGGDGGICSVCENNIALGLQRLYICLEVEIICLSVSVGVSGNETGMQQCSSMEKKCINKTKQIH